MALQTFQQPPVWATLPPTLPGIDPSMQPNVSQQPSVFDPVLSHPPSTDLKPLGMAVPHGGVPQVFAAPPELPDASRIPTPIETQVDETSGQLKKLQQQDADPYGSPDNHPGFGGKLLHVLGRIGNIAGDIVAPSVMTQIPGTLANREASENNLTQRLQSLTQSQAEDEDRSAQKAEREALAKKASALADADTPAPLSVEDAAAIGHPELAGLSISPRDREKYFAATQTNDSRETIGAGHDAARVAAVTDKPQQRDDHYIADQQAKYEAQGVPAVRAYDKAFNDWVNTTKTAPGVARAGAMNAGRPVQVVLPGGQAGYMTAGNAERTGATSMGDVNYKATGALLKDFTSGNDAHTLTAFNTAQGHLHQLNAAAAALQNNDLQALNKIANEYGLQTGSSAPVVFQTVKTALTGELAKAFTGAGATVNEVNELEGSLSAAESPQQLQDAANSYYHLLGTKKAALQGQFDAGKSGKPNFGNDGSANPPPAAAPKVGDVRPGADGNYRFKGGDQYDQKNWVKVAK